MLYYIKLNEKCHIWCENLHSDDQESSENHANGCSVVMSCHNYRNSFWCLYGWQGVTSHRNISVILMLIMCILSCHSMLVMTSNKNV